MSEPINSLNAEPPSFFGAPCPILSSTAWALALIEIHTSEPRWRQSSFQFLPDPSEGQELRDELDKILAPGWEQKLLPPDPSDYGGPPKRRRTGTPIIAEAASEVFWGETPDVAREALVEKLTRIGALSMEALTQSEAQRQHSLLQVWEWIPFNRNPPGLRRERMATVRGMVKHLVQRIVNIPQSRYEVETRHGQLSLRRTMETILRTVATVAEETEGTIAERQVWQPSPFLVLHPISMLPYLLQPDLSLLRLQGVQCIDAQGMIMLHPIPKHQYEFPSPKVQYRGRLPLELLGTPSRLAIQRLFRELRDTPMSEVLRRFLATIGPEQCLGNGEPPFWAVLDDANRILGDPTGISSSGVDTVTRED